MGKVKGEKERVAKVRERTMKTNQTEMTMRIKPKRAL